MNIPATTNTGIVPPWLRFDATLPVEPDMIMPEVPAHPDTPRIMAGRTH